jgi:hypothetical protein
MFMTVFMNYAQIIINVTMVTLIEILGLMGYTVCDYILICVLCINDDTCCHGNTVMIIR